MTVLFNSTLLMFSRLKDFGKKKSKVQPLVWLVFVCALETIHFSFRATHKETKCVFCTNPSFPRCVQTGAHTLWGRGTIQSMAGDLVAAISKCQSISCAQQVMKPFTAGNLAPLLSICN